MKQLENPIEFCVVLPDNRRTFELFQSFVVALAKSQDHREFYGVFALVATQCGTSVVAFGIPCYTSELKQGRWAKDRAEWFGRKSKKSVLCDAMTWLQREVIHKQSDCCFSTVRLCFAQTITKGK